jgi:hypothetical protein
MLFLVFVFAYYLIAVGCRASNGAFERRQTDCSGPCGWISGLDDCRETDTSCICVFTAAGESEIAACSNQNAQT